MKPESRNPGRVRRQLFRDLCNQLQRLRENGVDLRTPGAVVLEIGGEKYEVSTLDCADEIREALTDSAEGVRDNKAEAS